MKLVSVIIPTYGGGELLTRSVDSVLAQTYKNIEVVVVDDNGLGTENQIKTAEIMSKYENIPNVKYVCHDVNKNGSAARNTGVKNSKGEYISLLDDDDEYTPDNLQKQVEVLDELPQDYALTYCSNVTCLNGEKIKESHVSQSGNLLYEVLMHKVVIGSSSLVIRRSAWEALNGFDESFRRHQDWEFTARVAAGYKVKAVDNIGFIYHLEFRNAPQNYEVAKKYRIYYVEKMMPYIQTLPKQQQKKVILSNYISLLMPLLRTGQIRKFIKEFRSFKLGFAGFVAVLKKIYAYVFVNKNFWNLKKRKHYTERV